VIRSAGARKDLEQLEQVQQRASISSKQMIRRLFIIYPDLCQSGWTAGNI